MSVEGLSGPIGGGAHGWAFGASLRHGLEEGFLLPRDAERLRAEVAAAQIP